MPLKPIVLLLLCSGIAPIAGIAQADDTSTTVALSDTPATVQKTIQAQIGDGQMGEIDKSINDEETIYDVDLTARDGSGRDFSVAGDGTLLSVEVTLSEIPAAARQFIQTELNGGTLESIDKNVADSEITYDVQGTAKEGQERNFTVGDDGALLSMEVALSETPDAVQKSITSRSKGGRVTSINENFDEDVTNFDVDVWEGSETSFNVLADGTLASIRVSLAKVPPAARRTMEAQIAGGTILRVDRSFVKERGVMPFDVEGRKDGKPFDFSVGPRGRFLGMNP
jgi:hypothetical protein